MKRSVIAALACGASMWLFAVGSVQAVKAPPRVEEPSKKKLDYSASVVFANDWVFRGVSLSDEEFTVQGSLDVKSSTGLYVGAFASNVDFNDGDEASTELDVYGGYAGKITERLGFNLNVTYSTFPGADDDLNYNNIEYSPNLTYEIGRFYLHGGIAYSPEYFGDSGDAIYYDGNLDVKLPHEVVLALHGGRQTVEENDKFFAPDYTDWAVGLRRTIVGFNAGVSWHDTDLSRDECFGGQDICNGSFVFSVGRDLK